MPVRVKSRRSQSGQRDTSPFPGYEGIDWNPPYIGTDLKFKDVIQKFSEYFVDTIELPSSFEQLRTTAAGDCLRVLVDHLGNTTSNRCVVAALLALRWHYATEREHRGLSEARANACEIVAWRFLTRLSEREAVDFCLYEIPGKEALDATLMSSNGYAYEEEQTERSPLLGGNPSSIGVAASASSMTARRNELLHAIPKLAVIDDDSDVDTAASAAGAQGGAGILNGKDPAQKLKSLNALEIAAIANAKRFLSQYIVQKIITGLWNGEIIFWDSVSASATRYPRYYNPKTTDPYSRLRVPKYLKAWEVLFFLGFLVLYYSVVLARDFEQIPLVEVGFYIWLVAFLWDEFQEWGDAGIFYMTDIWNLFDMSMITLGVIFATLRVVGIVEKNRGITDLAFDILSLEALLVIPRIFSFLSLSPYWGTLIPCLKEMGKDFVKFMILVIIVYLGFLTTFSLVARDKFDLGPMTLDITKIFYGNTAIGFNIMEAIDPTLGPPLMILFITLTSILLTGSLTGMLSNSFSRVMAQAREEYLYVYSVYVLEASTSSRLTHFYPPLNLVALLFFRPWRIIFPKDDRFRHGRVIALKVTHAPIVLVIQAYEWLGRRITDYQEKDPWAGFSGGRTRSNSEAPPRRGGSGGPHRPPVGSPRRSGQSVNSRHGGGVGGGRFPQHGRPLHGNGSDAFLLPGARPSSSAGRSGWSATDDEDLSGPSNAELMKRLDKLTNIVAALENKISDRPAATPPSTGGPGGGLDIPRGRRPS